MASVAAASDPMAFRPRRKTPPQSVSELSPPITPPRSVPNSDNEEEVHGDDGIPDDYVQHTLRTQKELPPITWSNFLNEVNWISVIALTVTPMIGIYGAFTTKLCWQTALFSVFYYYVTGYVCSPVPRFHVTHASLPFSSDLELPLDTTVSGPTAHITPQSLWSISSLPPAPVRSKVPSSGGPVVIAHTTATPIPTSTHIAPTRVCSGRTLAG